MLLHVRRLFISFVSLLVVSIIALIFVHLIPSSMLQDSVTRSVQTLQSEGTYPSIGFPFRLITLDNFTDPLMLGTASFGEANTPVKNALLNYRRVVSDTELDQIKNLQASQNSATSKVVSYQRYWHGYIVYLRPLLVLFSYGQIRVIVGLMLSFSFLAVLWLLARQGAILRAVALLLSALAVDFFWLGQSLQFSQVFFVGLGSALWYLWQKQRGRVVDMALLFFITGALTSFFDLLTAPLVTLGILLIVTVAPLSSWKVVISYLAAWALGYVLFWISKWLLVELLFSTGAITEALGHVLNRTVHEADATFSHLRTIELNVRQLIGYDKRSKALVLAATVLTTLFILVFRRRQQIRWRAIVTWAIIGTLPYLWYLVAANHSYLHVWYTYRAQMVTVAAVIMIVGELVDWQRARLWLQSATKRRYN